MKKVLAIIALVIVLILSFSTPIAASGNPPISQTGAISLDPPENIGGILVGVSGTGTLRMHVNKPPSGRASEESWFEVSSFSGSITLNGLPIPVSASDVRVIIHNGTMVHQPIVTIIFAEPTFLGIPNPYNPGTYLLEPGVYSIIQMLGWGILFMPAKKRV